MWPDSRAAPADRRTGPRTERPSFVLIVADDLGYAELGSYGQWKISTPRLDRLAAEGLRFTDFYAGAPLCAPSRCTLLTGLHSGHCRVRSNPSGGDLPLTAADITIGTVLRAAGYRTGLFGKWGFGPPAPDQPSHPNAQGFDEFFGYITHGAAHQYFPARLWRDQGTVELARGRYAPDLIFDRAVEFVERHRADPFLLVLSLPLPHAPSAIPDPGRYAGESWTPADKGHAAQVTLLDSYVGRLVDLLGRLGLADNTIVIFTSDNGPHEEGGVDPDFFDANGGQRGYKRNLYEGGLRVPLIVWSPALLSRTAGRRSAHVSAAWDLLPTLGDFAGAARPDGLDGLSLRAVLAGTGTPAVRRYLYWARPVGIRSTPRQAAQDGGRGRRAAAAVRFGRWKLVGFGPGPAYSDPDERWSVELYDLQADSGERIDVAPAHPDRVAEGVSYLREAWRPPSPAR